MDFLKKISDIFGNLLSFKKDKDNINVPPESPIQNPIEEKPSEAPEQAPESEPIKQNFEASEGEGKGL